MGIANSEIGSAVDTSPLGLDAGGGKDDDSDQKRRNEKGNSKMAKDKFKSMGSLQMEPSLPTAPM